MINFSATAADAQAAALIASIDAGGAAGYAQLYNGSRPATGAAGAGALVATLPLAYPCGSVVASALAFSPGANAAALISSTPTWARIRTSAGAFVIDCNVRLVGATPAPDPEELVISAASIVAGGFIAVSGGAIGVPL